MPAYDAKLFIYALCVVVALVLHLMVFGAPGGGAGLSVFPGTSGLLVLLGATLFLGGAFLLWKDMGAEKALVRRLVGALLSVLVLYGVLYPLVLPDGLGPEGMRQSLLSTALWPQAFVCFFAGIVFGQLEKSGAGQGRGVGSFVCFGLVLTLAGYMGLRALIVPGTGGGFPAVLGAVFGRSVVHTLIFAVFLIVLSYVLYCAVVLPGRSTLEGPRRRFFRILISALPLLGFLGTVLGIMTALAGLPDLLLGDRGSSSDLGQALSGSFSGIALAFETTLLGLVGSLIATIGLALVEKREAEALLDG